VEEGILGANLGRSRQPAARLAITLGVIGPLALASAGARADPGLAQAELRYSLGPGAGRCPEVAAMREAVAARLGYVPWREGASRTVAVTVERGGQELRARIELRDAAGRIEGQRELASRSADCRELAAAIELAVSLAVDPLSLARPSGQRLGPRAQSHDGEPIPEQKRASPGSGASDPAPGQLEVSASVGGHFAFASAPSPTGGLTLQGRLRVRALSAALEGRIDFPSYGDVPGGQVSTALYLGSVVGCYHPWRLMGCALFAAGGLRGTGHGLDGAESHTLPYLACGLRLGIEIPIVPRLAVRVYGDFLVALSHITLQTSGEHAAELWSTPAVSGDLGLALVGTFR
jgi:hypothetical protein